MNHHWIYGIDLYVLSLFLIICYKYISSKREGIKLYDVILEEIH